MHRTFACLFFLLVVVGYPCSALSNQPQDQFTFILPAQALHQSLQTILPLPLEPEGPAFDGTLSIDSIDTLRIHDDMISLHGIVSGKNLAMSTELAGQTIKLKLGQVTLPMTCDLLLRFDQSKKQLYVTPQFKPSATPDARGSQALLPLLAALGGKEYPVDLRQLQSIQHTVGSHSLQLQLQPVNVSASNNQLILGLKPQTGNKH